MSNSSQYHYLQQTLKQNKARTIHTFNNLLTPDPSLDSVTRKSNAKTYRLDHENRIEVYQFSDQVEKEINKVNESLSHSLEIASSKIEEKKSSVNHPHRNNKRSQKCI